MAILGYDEARCLKRNRIAAMRDGVEAVPFRFQGSATVTAGDKRAVEPLMSDDEAMMRINGMRGGEPLALDQVYIHYAEAANGNYVSDRSCFLATSTLKNIATDAQRGFAFMNSHRTGSLSHPSELPFGKTFAGKYFAAADEQSERTVVGVYMLKGIRPNGEHGPSTDDMHAGIDAGTIFDVSVGLNGGAYVCDVCGNDLDAYDSEDGWLCPHIPGTTRQMSADEIDAQKARGVDTGVASYTLTDANCGELSAVYDGAVPGAGFRKFSALDRAHKLSDTDAAQARHAYARFLKGKDNNNMDAEDIVKAISDGFAKLGSSLGMNGGQRIELSAATLGKVAEPAAPAAPDAETLAKLTAQETQLAAQAAQIEELRKENAETARKGQLAQDLSWIEGKVKAFYILPAAADAFKKLAESNPTGFAATKDAIEANGPVVALAGNGTDAAALAANTASGRSEGAKLEELAKKHAAEHGVSYTDAYYSVCKEHKDLAAAYRASQTGGL